MKLSDLGWNSEFLGLTLLPGSGAVLFSLFINQMFDPQRWSRYLCNRRTTDEGFLEFSMINSETTTATLYFTMAKFTHKIKEKMASKMPFYPKNSKRLIWYFWRAEFSGLNIMLHSSLIFDWQVWHTAASLERRRTWSQYLKKGIILSYINWNDAVSHRSVTKNSTDVLLCLVVLLHVQHN